VVYIKLLQLNNLKIFIQIQFKHIYATWQKTMVIWHCQEQMSCHISHTGKFFKRESLGKLGLGIIEAHTHMFNGPLSGTTRVSRYQKGETNLDFTEARDSGISWVICKSAPRSRQITTPAPHRSVFYRLDALPAAQPTVSQQALKAA